MKLGLSLSLSTAFRGAAVPQVPSAPGVSRITGSSINANQSIYTFSGISLGEAIHDRIIAVGVYAGTSNNSFVLTATCTIAGIVAGKHVVNNASNSKLIIFSAAVPGGATGDIIVETNTGNITHCRIEVYRIVGATSAIPSDTDTAAGLDLSRTLTVPNNGMAIGIAGSVASVGTYSWTGLTLDNGTTIESDPVSCASGLFVSGGELAFVAVQSAPDATDGAVYAVWTPAT